MISVERGFTSRSAHPQGMVPACRWWAGSEQRVSLRFDRVTVLKE